MKVIVCGQSTETYIFSLQRYRKYHSLLSHHVHFVSGSSWPRQPCFPVLSSCVRFMSSMSVCIMWTCNYGKGSVLCPSNPLSISLLSSWKSLCEISICKPWVLKWVELQPRVHNDPHVAGPISVNGKEYHFYWYKWPIFVPVKHPSTAGCKCFSIPFSYHRYNSQTHSEHWGRLANEHFQKDCSSRLDDASPVSLPSCCLAALMSHRHTQLHEHFFFHLLTHTHSLSLSVNNQPRNTCVATGRVAPFWWKMS